MSGSKGHKITLGMLKGKSITTSVPSIAIRFHTGDEEVDIYPSADDEEEDEKEEEGASPPTVSPSATPSIPSRDPSPMKEYLRGLGKRSTSVDGGMADAGSTTSDTWRIFHELKGKITKTVEEKLTEMKNDRKASGTPILSGLKNRRRRLRAGGFDNSSISDSEDISEASNKGEAKEQDNPSTDPCYINDFNETRDKTIKFSGSVEEDVPSTSTEQGTSKKKTKKEKHRKDKSRRKSNSSSDSNSTSSLSPVESGVEILEDTKFIGVEDYENVPTIDFRTNPPTMYNISDQSLNQNIESERSLLTFSCLFKEAWSYRYAITAVIVMFVYIYFPLPPYISGLLMGTFLTMSYHFIVGLQAWFEPADLPNVKTEPFVKPDFTSEPLLTTPSLNDMTLTATKCAGWMNELPVEEYNADTYHINNTQTVYVHLEGSTLKISHPKSKIQRRATFNEKKYKMKFIHQRIYNISGCKLMLLPDGLTRKRTWSKKYPICIKLTTESALKKEIANLSQLIPPPEDDSLSIISREASADSLLENHLADGTLLEDGVSNTSFVRPELSQTSIDLPQLGPTITIEKPSVPDLVQATEPVTPSDDETFCLIDKSILNETRLFLFARTDRQKEDWYSRLAIAVRQPVLHIEEEQVDDMLAPEITIVPEPTFSTASYAGAEFITSNAHEIAASEYLEFMNVFNLQVKPFIMGTASPGRQPPPNIPTFGKYNTSGHNMPEPGREINGDVLWINAMMGHVLFDILDSDAWKQKIRLKVERKLEAIKTPYFMDTLILRDIEYGRDVPLIHRASRPIIDAHGLWVDLDVSFEGRIILTIETKLNLMKLKTGSTEQDVAPPAVVPSTETITSPEKSKSPIYDSDLEDSAESSETELESPSNKTSSDTDPDSQKLRSGIKSPEASPSKRVPASGKGMIRVMNKIVSSKYFQQATENKYIKRAMEGVSNTTITLAVEIRACTGQLALNLPPPPSDRLWFGFRGNPKVWIKARPKFGDRHLNIKHVVSWIEKKLLQEFQKHMVLPNMKNVVIPALTPNLCE